jgi:hypothetical protein
MEILSHRGWWEKPEEKNTELAFYRAFQAGFGIETDVRDSLGELVVSHDPARGDEIYLETMLELYGRVGNSVTLALNIKGDGLQALLVDALQRYRVTNYFVFDMSLPEMVRYRATGLLCYTRLSDLEPIPLMLAGADGVWVDGFERDWSDLGQLSRLLLERKRLALVSPELHRRPHEAFWELCREWWRGLPPQSKQRVQLCTDLPATAKDYFYE